MLLGLTSGEWIYAIAAVFVAGAVRGFAGFALSALIMATLVSILPPIQLIPICTTLELAASGLLIRGGFADADKRMVLALQTGAVIGVPAGLALTTSIDPDASRLVALVLILTLAALQLARIPLPVGAGTASAFATGILSGFATGLASVGGMVIALYTLARQMPARVMRGSLILTILIGGVLTLGWQMLYGMLTEDALSRAAILALPALAGVWLGRRYFTAENARHYRPFCLALLIGLAAFGLARQML